MFEGEIRSLTKHMGLVRRVAEMQKPVALLQVIRADLPLTLCVCLDVFERETVETEAALSERGEIDSWVRDMCDTLFIV